jgi:WhiB family transcriptional regulator, redox-sensing transcriptional regulator
MTAPTPSDTPTVPGRDWIAQAACRDADPAVFTVPADDVEVAQALATCARCPVARTCLATALAHDQVGDIGIWGGTTVEVRDQIRAGTHTREDALHLQTGPYRPDQDRTPMVAVTPDEHGDYTDNSGRILITRLPAGDYATFVDQRLVARTPTLTEACQAARTGQRLEPAPRPSARLPSPDLLEVQVDEHGDHVDASGRILITRAPTEPPYLVFLDDQLNCRAETLNRARAAAHATLYDQADTRGSKAASRFVVAAANDDRQRPRGHARERGQTARAERDSPGRAR